MDWLFGFVVWFLGSAAVGAAAGRWGRSVGGYWLASLFLSPIVAGLWLVGEGPAAPRALPLPLPYMPPQPMPPQPMPPQPMPPQPMAPQPVAPQPLRRG